MVLNDSLRFFSASIPGGVFTTMALARVSTDEGVRRVAALWNALPRKEHKTVNLDDLCWKAGVTPARVLGSIAETALELGMDVSQFLHAIRVLPSAFQAEAARAQTGTWRDRERFLRASGFLSDPNATAARRDAAVRDSELEPIEEDTMYWTRMLKASLRRELRQQGGR